MDLWWLVQWGFGFLCGWLVWGRNRYNSVNKTPRLPNCYGYYVSGYTEDRCEVCPYRLQCGDKTRYNNFRTKEKVEEWEKKAKSTLS